MNSLYRVSPSSGAPLRIGILLDSTRLENFFAEIVDDILSCSFAKIELLVFNAETAAKPAAAPSKGGLWRKLALLSDAKRRASLGWDLYQKYDQKFFGTSDNPFVPVDCSARLAGIERIDVKPVSKRFVHRFPPEAIAQIREKRLDVLLRFGFNILKGDILDAAQYGVWSYHHGDNDYYRGGPAHFWEIYEKNPLSGVILQVLTEELDAGKVLCKATFSTASGLSLARNRYAPYWGTTYLVIQKLYELHTYGWEHLSRRMTPPAPYRGKRKLYRQPTNWEICRWLVSGAFQKAAGRLFRRDSVQQWRIAIRAGGDLMDGGSMAGFNWIESPPGHYYADPWLVKSAGKIWLFFEDMVYAKGRGAIACAEVLPDGRIGSPRTVLLREYHLSYPCVFEYGGEHYMIPESKTSCAVELYRAKRFPYEWEMVTALFRGKAVDTTVFVNGNRCWFFVTVVGERGVGSTLLLFSSNCPLGKWTYHPANPISTDVRTVRGAGAVFRRNGKLYRPSQDCSTGYGSSFTLNEITSWSDTEYTERPALTVDASWFKGTGSHTYARCDGMEAVDGSTAEPGANCLVPGDFFPAA